MTATKAKATEPKKLTTEEKLAALVALAKANGWSVPKNLED